MSYLHEVPADENQIPAFGAMLASFGFIPNFFKAQAIRPDLIEAEAQLVDAIMLKEGALTRQQKEYIFLVCSAANLSTYCVAAHCEIIRMLGIQGPDPERVAVDYATADLPMTLKALLAFAAKLNRDMSKIARRDVNALRTYGYTEEQILETVLMVGLAKFANYVAAGLGAEPDFDLPQVVGEQLGMGGPEGRRSAQRTASSGSS
jgi:uncharacterized peroxidase-related enzyme